MSVISVEVEKKAAITLFELVCSALKGGAKRLGEEKQVRAALDTYIARYQERHGMIKVLGMSEPMPLNDIYTEGRLLAGNTLRRYATAAELEAVFRESRRHTTTDPDSVQDAFEIANAHARLTILGPPGSGKSTFLRRLGQCSLLGDGPYQHRRLPVLLALTQHRSCRTPADLIAAMAVEFAVCGFPESNAFVTRMLEDGRLLVLLDGLDEVPGDSLSGVIGSVRDLVDRYSTGPETETNRFVITCRTAHYKSWFERFTDVVMADFSDARIQKFTQNWFRSEENKNKQTASHFWQLLQHQAPAMEIARTPLLLTFLCLVYEEGQALPRVRATLYKDALEILLRRWSAAKRVHHDPIYADLHHDLELDMLARIAHDFFVADKVFFTRDELLDGIRGFMAGELNAPKTLDAGGILDAIAVQQGLLVERASGVWSFSHLTIQEYLTARHLWNTHSWRGMVREHLFDVHWHEIFVLLAGMGKADGLLEELAAAMDSETVRRPHYAAWLKWIDQVAAKAEPPPDSPQESLALRLLLVIATSSVAGTAKTWTLYEYHVLQLLCRMSMRLNAMFKEQLSNAVATIRIETKNKITTPVTPWLELELRIAQVLARTFCSAHRWVANPFSGPVDLVAFTLEFRRILNSPVPPPLSTRGITDTVAVTFNAREAAYSVSPSVWDRVCNSLVRYSSDAWKYGSTQTSTALEGNTLTAEDVRTAILHPEASIPGKPREQVEEVRSHDAALRQLETLLAERRDFAVRDLLALHTTLMAGTTVDYLRPIGEWKRETNQTVIRMGGQRVTNDTYANPGHVPALMGTWLAEFNRLVRAPVDLMEAHIWLHAAFVRIHPFADGNGRMARMLANAPYISRGLFPLDIQPEDRDRYLEALARWQIACGPPIPGASLVPEEHRAALDDFRGLCAERAPEQ